MLVELPSGAGIARQRKVSLSMAAIALLPMLLASCKSTPPPAPPPPPQVHVAPALFQPLRQWDDFTGRLEAVESVEVRPRVGGFIDSISFADGALVRRGQLLFQIDPRPYQDEVNRLVAELQEAQAKAVLAKADGGRGKRLIDQNAIAQGEFERLDAESKSAAASVSAARAALDTARLNLSFTRVTSPIDGRVSKAMITRGNLITTSSLLTTVMSSSPIYAAFNADEQTYLKYAGDQRGKEGPVFVGLITETGFPHRGRLHFLDNAVDGGSGTISGRAVLDNADGRLTPGLFSRVRLVSTAAVQVALVPEQALGTDLGKRFVLVLDPANHVQARGVTLGPAVGDLQVIETGLHPGDMVVVSGLQKAKPGELVSPVRTTISVAPAELAQLEPAQ